MSNNAPPLLSLPRHRHCAMKRYRPDPKKPRQLTKSDLDRLDRMTDDEIDYSDIPPLDDEFSRRRPSNGPRQKANRCYTKSPTPFPILTIP
jgi:hypothetical protein